MSDIQGDYRKIANKFGHYSDTRGMLAGMVIELADRIEELEAKLKQAQEFLRTARDFAIAYKEKADKAEATIEANNSFLIKSAASCARMQGGLWSNDEYPFSKDELRTKLNLAAHFISNTGTELRDKALQ